MKNKQARSKQALVFSKWSRKGYAVFASLHKEVVIAYLSIDLCVASFSKLKSLIQLFSITEFKEKVSGEEGALGSGYVFPGQLLMLCLYVSLSVGDSIDYLNNKFLIINKSPLSVFHANNGLF